MVFSLQRRFILFLFLPVTLVLLLTSVAAFFYAQFYLLHEWESAAKIRLEKMGLEIKTKLDQKREIIALLADAQTTPDSNVTQVFLVQHLLHQDGVRFVDIRDTDKGSTQSTRSNKQTDAVPSARGAGKVTRDRESILKREPATNENVQGPMMMNPMMPQHPMMMDRMRSRLGGMTKPKSSPGATTGQHYLMMRGRRLDVSLDESGSFLSIVKEVEIAGKLEKKIVVTVSFDSFMKGILEASDSTGTGSYACLVSSDGKYLAHTDPSMYTLHELGETGHSVDKRVLEEMKKQQFGTVYGEGYPPHWIVGFYRVPTTDWYLLVSSKGSVVLAPIMRFQLNYLLTGLASLLLVGLVIRLNTRPVARSVREISQAAASVEEGDFSVSVPEDRSDEIGELKRRFNQMIAGLRHRELIERTFGRYVDKAIAQELMNSPAAVKLGGHKQIVTVLMCDLRGFTRIAEKLPSEEVIKLLNRYLGSMISVIERHKGIIVDFYGDSVLVFFNGFGGSVSERAYDAVKCGLEMHRELEHVSSDNEKEGLPRLAMGIGVHTGEVVVGNIGSETRAKYGIVGSAVNETDRIQSLAQGGVTMISEQTYALVNDRISVGQKCQASLKGLEGERDLYEVTSLAT